MSLLLDALKKAAEKNAQQNADKQAEALDSKQSGENVDATQQVDASSDEDRTQLIEPELLDKPEGESVTEIELAKIIAQDKQSKVSKAADELNDNETLVDESASSIEDASQDTILETQLDSTSIDEQKDSTSVEDDDPSLKLALENEEIELTDDDVTAFLGNDNAFDLGDLTLEKSPSDTEYTNSDNTTHSDLSEETDTRGLNLSEMPTGVDSSLLGASADNTSTTGGFGATTNLNSLTNESTFNAHGNASAANKGYAADNYDRTLVKLDDDGSSAFGGIKAPKPGEAMTPDFAKKVFVSKSTSLRRQHYKLYLMISLALFIVITLYAVFEMQGTMDEIDSSLVRLKQNPVPAELRYKQPQAEDEDLAILNGKVDTEALKLLKSIEESAKVEPQSKSTASVSGNETALATSRGELPSNSDLAQSEKSQEVVNRTSAKQSNSQNKQQAKAISIKASVKETEESVLLNEAYQAYTAGDITGAETSYRKVLDIDAENRDALLGQAAIFVGQNKNNQAIENYQKILLLNPKDPLAMTSLIAASSISPEESESRLKLMHRETPNASYLQFAIGNVVSAQNRWQEAQQYYFMAYQSEPTSADYAYNLAVSLEQINKPDVAVTYYQQALNNAELGSSASFDKNLIQERIEVLLKP